MQRGTIASIRPDGGDGHGFGMITPASGGRGLIFYRASADGSGAAFARRLRNLLRIGTAHPSPFDGLTVGQAVTFVLGEDSTQAGRACAEHVRPYEVPSGVS